MKDNITRMFLTVFVIVFITAFLSSCKEGKNINGETTKAETPETEMFEYTDSDDRPNELNAIKGSKNIKFYDGFLYITKPNPTILKPILLRFNPKTGNFTYVCTDPLCGHDTDDCPLYGLFVSFYIYDNTIYFLQKYIKDHRNPSGGGVSYLERYTAFKSYDLSDAKLTVYEEQSDINLTENSSRLYNIQLYAGKYRYYYDNVYNEKLEKYVFSICRMDLDTKERIVYDSESNTSSYLSLAFLFCHNDRIYFSDLKTVYSTDYNLENKKEIAKGKFSDDMLTDGDYIYWEAINDSNKKTLHRMSLEGGEVTDLQIRASSWQLTSNYIYYVDSDIINAGDLKLSSSSSDKLALKGSELRRCAHDGSGDELVWKFEGEYEFLRFTEWLVVGNYIYAYYSNWTDTDGDGFFGDNDHYQSFDLKNYNIMRIGIMAGDVNYIYPND